MRMLAKLQLSVLSVALGLWLACAGGGSNNVQPGSTANITSFLANPNPIDPGQTSTLTGVFDGGSGLITPGNLVAASGAPVQVTPLATTTYTLAVLDPHNRSVTRTATVTVRAAAIASFSADLSSIALGGTVQLTGVFSNGTGLITPGNLSVVSGTPVAVTPAVSTTYTLTVSGLAGTTATATVTITVTVSGPSTLSVFAGAPGQPGSTDGAAADARFSSPAGVAVDALGNFLVADTPNGTIRAVTPAGQVSTLAGTAGFSGHADGLGAAATFSQPRGVAVDGNGNVFVADTGNSTVRLITPAGQVSTLAGLAGATGNSDSPVPRFNLPGGLAVDASGTVYVADTQSSTIRKISPQGIVTTLAGSPGLTGTNDGLGSAARFFLPQGVALDAANNVFVADTGNSTIRRISPAGQVSTVAGIAGVPGSGDGQGLAAQFNHPVAVAVDAAGVLYVADTGNSTIRRIDAAGVVTTVAGVPGSGGSVVPGPLPALLAPPLGVVLDALSGALFVTSDSAILKIQF